MGSIFFVNTSQPRSWRKDPDWRRWQEAQLVISLTVRPIGLSRCWEKTIARLIEIQRSGCSSKILSRSIGCDSRWKSRPWFSSMKLPEKKRNFANCTIEHSLKPIKSRIDLNERRLWHQNRGRAASLQVAKSIRTGRVAI